MTKERKLQEILRLHRDCSARFSGYVLRLLMENADVKENIALSPARLQAVLILLANWITQEIRKRILDMAVGEVMSLEEANLLFDFANIKPLSHDDFVFRDEEGNSIPMIPDVEQQTTLWHKENLAVNKEAVEKIQMAFNACTKAIDFATPEAKKTIDEDVCNTTHGLIEHLDTQIDASVLALLVDVLYFKGAWEEEFDNYKTADRMFYGTKGKLKVPTMRRTGMMEYVETPMYQAVSLPYTCMSINHKRFAMRVYLPTGKHTITDVLEEMRNDEYEFRSECEEVKLSLPCFEVSNKVDVEAILKNMGLACILESKDIIPDCIKDLQISDIVQQVKIKVNESGTEAAAATFTPMVGCSPSDEKLQPKIMKVNKPFLFEIVEESTNMVLFSGVVNNIESIIIPKKGLSKDELIARLKEISADNSKRNEIDMGAMCYSPAALPIEHAECEICGADIAYENWHGEHDEIYKTIRKIVALGYDAKVKICCMKCAEQLAEEFYPEYEILSDDNHDYYNSPNLGKINYLFSFKPKDEDKYHSCIANDEVQYKSLLALLENRTTYTDYYDSLRFVADEKDLLEYMTGINFDEQD